MIVVQSGKCVHTHTDGWTEVGMEGEAGETENGRERGRDGQREEGMRERWREREGM